MNEIATPQSTFELIIRLIEVIIWPFCFLLILLIYKSHFARAIQRIGSIKADATGISMVFDQKIEAAKNLAKQIAPNNTQKMSTEILVNPENINRHPFDQLKKMQFELENKLKKIADQFNIPPGNLNPSEGLQKLKEIGAISIQNVKLIEMFLDIANSADKGITLKHLGDCKTIYNAIQL